MDRHIVHVVTNRASYGRLKAVLQEIKNTDGLKLTVIKAGAGVDLDIESKYNVRCLFNDDSHAGMVKTASLLAIELSTIFEQIKPDIVLIHGDRYEQLGVAMAASYLNIPIAHTEGGEISGCIDDKVRNAITALADIHFPVTRDAFYNVLSSRKSSKNINLVGSPAIDLCKKAVEANLNIDIEEPYILVLHHPNTSLKEEIEPMVKALNDIPFKKIWINPNIDAGSKELSKLLHKTDWEFKKNLTPEEYYTYLSKCEVAVGNSSSFIKEGAFLGVPAVIVGKRQTDREVQENILFADDANYSDILEKIHYQLEHGKYESSYEYGDGNSAKKIASILQEVSL